MQLHAAKTEHLRFISGTHTVKEIHVCFLIHLFEYANSVHKSNTQHAFILLLRTLHIIGLFCFFMIKFILNRH